jgi:hypothetical protein
MLEPLAVLPKPTIITTNRQAGKVGAENAVLAWESMAARFEKCSHFISANYQTTNNVTRWDVKGSYVEVKSIEVLFKKAGLMLLKSEKSRESVGAIAVVRGLEPMDYWLEVIKSKSHSDSTRYGTEVLNDGTTLLHVLGSVPTVSVLSYQLCMECSAYEL